jgi:hypothetical protein
MSKTHEKERGQCQYFVVVLLCVVSGVDERKGWDAFNMPLFFIQTLTWNTFEVKIIITLHYSSLC